MLPRPGIKQERFLPTPAKRERSNNTVSWRIYFPLPCWHDRSHWMLSWHKRRPLTKEHKALGSSPENPLQFSSMLVKLQKTPQWGVRNTTTNQLQQFSWCVCQQWCCGIIGIIVRLELRTNPASSWWAPAVSFKGTWFWRCSQGHITHQRVGETVRLIKWLPLISAMHMKGLCLLHDRFYASSPRDLPRYTEQTLGGKQCITCTASS